jgi:DNA-binding transcriptional LysR family regulator
MQHLDTETLAAFLAVIDFGSFTSAATHLRKSQAAVSLAISRLEDRLGQKLLERSYRRITLTEAGERLLIYARRIQALEAEALSDMLGQSTESRVRLGMPDDYLACFGTALIERFTPEFPHIYIDLRCQFSRRLEQMIDNRELDLAIITQSIAQPRGDLLRQERQFWCTAPDAAPEQLDCLPLALFSEECPARPSIFTILQQIGQTWRVVYSSSHLAGVHLAVASGKLLTVLPEPAIPATWRRLGPEHGLPHLPPLPLALLAAREPRLPVRQLAAFLRREFGNVAVEPVAAQ